MRSSVAQPLRDLVDAINANQPQVQQTQGVADRCLGAFRRATRIVNRQDYWYIGEQEMTRLDRFVAGAERFLIGVSSVGIENWDEPTYYRYIAKHGKKGRSSRLPQEASVGFLASATSVDDYQKKAQGFVALRLYIYTDAEFLRHQTVFDMLREINLDCGIPTSHLDKRRLLRLGYDYYQQDFLSQASSVVRILKRRADSLGCDVLGLRDGSELLSGSVLINDEFAERFDLPDFLISDKGAMYVAASRSNRSAVNVEIPALDAVDYGPLKIYTDRILLLLKQGPWSTRLPIPDWV